MKSISEMKNIHRLLVTKFFTQANEKRMLKATSVCVIPEDLQEIRNRTYCVRMRSQTFKDRW